MSVICYSMERELTSPKWARAFAAGCLGEVSMGNALLEGDVAMFGSPKRWELLQYAIGKGRTWYYGDHAYFRRCEYYRITKNAYQLEKLSGSGDSKRFDALNIPIKRWKVGGSILLCPNSNAYFVRAGITADSWVKATAKKLREYTGREIRVRYKVTGGSLEDAMNGTHAVVVYTSVCGVHAALAGISCFATEPCASRCFGTSDLSLIENPVRPDNRYSMACELANHQWTFEEMASGQAWRELNKYD